MENKDFTSDRTTVLNKTPLLQRGFNLYPVKEASCYLLMTKEFLAFPLQISSFTVSGVA